MSQMEGARMRAVQFDRYGAADVLVLRRTEVPEPGAGEVLVRVHASGLNPKDVMLRSGALRLQSGRTFPRGIGFDFSGEVAAVGPDVADLAIGGRVWGFLDGLVGGAAAEYVVARRTWLSLMPEQVGWREGAALPLVASAALQALRDVADLQAGERLLIKGASGGVGSAAIQIARAMGADVTALTSRAGHSYCSALGAHRTLNAAELDPGRVRGRFDVYLDCAGHSPLRKFTPLLSRTGRWVTVAPSVPIFILSPISRALGGILPVPRLGFVMVRPVDADLEELGRWVEQGLLRMPVSATYSLEEIALAHAEMDAVRARGKRVVTVTSEAASEARPMVAEALDADAARVEPMGGRPR